MMSAVDLNTRQVGTGSPEPLTVGSPGTGGPTGIRRWTGADSSVMAGRTQAIGLAVALALGLAIRLVYFALQRGMHHPDEVFQYLEPATWRIQGYGWLPWEFVRGARNWILPGYYGALMEVGGWFGLTGYPLYRFLQLHNALVSLILIPAAYRLGCAVGGADRRAGLFAAFAVALCPYLAYFAPHTLSESAGVLLTTWAYALWMEDTGRSREAGRRTASLGVGLLLGGAVVARYSLAVFIPLVLLDFLIRRRWSQLGWCLLGLMASLVAVGLVDWATWGKPFHSAVEYLKFNILEAGADRYGVYPGSYYLTEVLRSRLGTGAILLAIGMVLFIWRHWRLVAAWIIPLVVLSRLSHKEERFLLSIWPFFLVAGINGILATTGWLARLRGIRRWGRPGGWRVVLGTAVACILLGTVLWFNFSGTSKLPLDGYADLFVAQGWVGRRSDATGVLLDQELNINGGYTVLGRNIPIWRLQFDLLGNPVFNYVVAHNAGFVAAMRRRSGFFEVGQIGTVTVFHRTTDAILLSPGHAAVH